MRRERGAPEQPARLVELRGRLPELARLVHALSRALGGNRRSVSGGGEALRIRCPRGLLLRSHAGPRLIGGPATYAGRRVLHQLRGLRLTRGDAQHVAGGADGLVEAARIVVGSRLLEVLAHATRRPYR